MSNNIITLFNNEVNSNDIKKVVFNKNIDTIKLFTLETIETLHVAHIIDNNNIYIVNNSFNALLHIVKKDKQVIVYEDNINDILISVVIDFLYELKRWGYELYYNI